MYKFTIARIMLIILMPIQCAYAESSDVSVRATYAMETKGGGMMFDGKQWVPQGKTKVEGGISLFVKVDGSETRFSTSITGTKKKGTKVLFKCKNGESFYLKVKAAHPFTSKKFTANKKQLKKLADKYRKNKTDKLAWSIWRQVDVH